jgi:hypothetical protein
MPSRPAVGSQGSVGRHHGAADIEKRHVYGVPQTQGVHRPARAKEKSLSRLQPTASQKPEGSGPKPIGHSNPFSDRLGPTGLPDRNQGH